MYTIIALYINLDNRHQVVDCSRFLKECRNSTLLGYICQHSILPILKFDFVQIKRTGLNNVQQKKSKNSCKSATKGQWPVFSKGN